MRILFDNGTPRGLAKFLVGHEVEEARSLGWEELVNGKLLAAAEQAGFDAILTNDKNIPSQQNLSGRRIAVLALQNSQWPMVKLVAEEMRMPDRSAKFDAEKMAFNARAKASMDEYLRSRSWEERRSSRWSG